jgi:ligand-binding sensor domain-containing protein/signal transduction histidine kinase
MTRRSDMLEPYNQRVHMAWSDIRGARAKAVERRGGRVSFRRSLRMHAGMAVMWIGCAIAPRADSVEPIPALDPDFEWRLWTQHHGLPDNEVRDLLPSSRGYLWISTRGGLARFDGREFAVFASDNVPEILEEGCGALAEDADGSLWLGTADGLLRINHTIQRFEPSRLEIPDDEEVFRQQRDMVTALYAAPTGGVWVGTHRGLLLWRDGAFHSFRLMKDTGQWISNVSHRVMIHALFAHPEIGTWAGLDWSPVLYDSANSALRTTTAAGKPGLAGKAAAFGQTRDGTFYTLLAAPGSTQAARLHRWNGGEWIPVSQRWLSNGSRRLWLCPDSLGRLWIPDGEGAILWFEDGKFNRLEMPSALRNDYVTCMIEDREGSFWLGTESKGISRMRPRRIHRLTSSDGLPDPNVRAVCAGRDGSLWLGTDQGLARLRAGKIELLGRSHGPITSNLRALAIDRVGRVWGGGRSGGFILSDASDHALKRLPFAGEWFNAKIRAILPGTNGVVWVGTATGLFPFAEDQGEPLSQVVGLSGKDVRVLRESASGVLWVGTEAQGLFGIREGEVVAHHLAGTSVYALWEDPQGTLWAGTRSGLARLEGPRVGWITARQGLPEDLIHSLIEDDRGWFWIGTESGIHRVPREEIEAMLDGRQPRVFPVRYGTEEGLGEVETHGQTSQPSVARALDGCIWFPTANGIVGIDPDRVPDVLCPPSVLIEAVHANGQLAYSNLPMAHDRWRGVPSPDSAHPPAMPSDRTRNVGADEPLRLAPGSADALEFRYTACTFVEADSVRFFHRIEGVDADWVDAGLRRSAAYFNVAPGRYRFHVKARNKYGVESATEATIDFNVAPYFSQTSGFYVLCIAASLLIIGGAWQWRLAGVRRVQRLEQKLALSNERERLARDLHDVLGARLHQITLLSETATSGGLPAEHVRLARLSRSSRQALGSLKDLIWATNPQNDSVSGLVDRIQQYAEDFLSTAEIPCRFQLPDDLPEVALPPDHRVSLLNAFREALTNVVRHAQARTVCIQVDCTHSDLIVSIADDGKGFDSSVVNSGSSTNGAAGDSHGLRNMRHRIESCAGGRFKIDSQPGRGTNIQMRVALPRADSRLS